MFRAKTKPLQQRQRIARWAKNRRQLTAARCLSLCAGSAARPQHSATSNRPFPPLISSFPDRSERARGVKRMQGNGFWLHSNRAPPMHVREAAARRLLSDLEICFCLKSGKHFTCGQKPDFHAASRRSLNQIASL